MNVGASEGTDTNDPNVSSDVHGEPKLVIWGTDVVVAETKSNFRKFIMSFMFDHEADESQNEYDPSRPYYIQKMEEIAGMYRVIQNLELPFTGKTAGCSLKLGMFF